MVNALTFDTHQFVKDLTAVGFTPAQAETVTALVRKSREGELVDLATRADLDRFATRVDLAETKADLLKWMVGSIAFQTLAVLGGVAALMRLVP